MDLCSPSPNTTIGNTNITWAQAESNVLNVYTHPSYLRPNTGGALLPWVYTIIVIIIHLPVVIIRVVRWEVVQSWCLVSTLFTVIVYIQAFISTKFDASKVLVWTPLILVIDAGSMLQVFFLVIEAKKVFVGNRVMLMDPQDGKRGSVELEGSVPGAGTTRESSSLLAHYRAWRTHADPSTQPLTNEIGLDMRGTNGSVAPKGPSTSSSPVVSAEDQLQWRRDPAIYAATIAALLFIAVLVLQLVGLSKASQAAKASSAPPLV